MKLAFRIVSIKPLARNGKSFLLLLFFITGCVKLGTPATATSAEDFRKFLLEQLRASGQVEDWVDGSAESDTTYTKGFGYLLPAGSFPPERLYAAADAAAKKWGHLREYSDTGIGGGGNRFEMDYGDQNSHAFIDVLAYPERDKTHIEVLIRVFR